MDSNHGHDDQELDFATVRKRAFENARANGNWGFYGDGLGPVKIIGKDGAIHAPAFLEQSGRIHLALTEAALAWKQSGENKDLPTKLLGFAVLLICEILEAANAEYLPPDFRPLRGNVLGFEEKSTFEEKLERSHKFLDIATLNITDGGLAAKWAAWLHLIVSEIASVCLAYNLNLHRALKCLLDCQGYPKRPSVKFVVRS